ncbi:MAG: periplasmic heavy metal sensor [Gammaproteobacteria bacterium]|nr:periplasmic heavy metal sensor [Gammaproteobacteria bacterium]
MNTLTRSLTLAATLLLASTVFAAPGDCNGGSRRANGPGGDPWRGVLSELDLSSEQQTAIDKLLDDARDQRLNNREQRRDRREQHHEQMVKLLQQESFDEAAASALLAAEDETRDQQRLAMMKLHHQIGRQLNDKQREQLVALLDEWFEERGPRGGRGK